MELVLAELAVAPSGTPYRIRVCGRERPDGTWEGWTEFDVGDGSPVLRTPRETTQPNLADLQYWATGLTPVYLEGALQRALHAAAATAPLRQAGPETGAIGPVHGAVLDPFSVYRKGAALLRRQLGALGRRHLLGIVRAYDLGGDEVEALTEPELIELIVARVGERRAA
jgi:hypothetical protein